MAKVAAKAAKAAEKPAKPEKAEKAKKETPEFDINYLAKQLGREPHLVRTSLRRQKIEKNGGRYAWDSKADADEVVAKLKRDEPEEKPAKKAPAKTEKTAKGKKAA